MLDRLISTSQKGDICFNSSNISVGKIHANISLFQQNHHTLLFKKLLHQPFINSSCQKKERIVWEPAEGRVGGVEQLHAIAQNHSTIILPSHKSPNNTETLLAIFKNYQEEIFTDGWQNILRWCLFSPLEIILECLNSINSFFKVFCQPFSKFWGCLIVTTAHHWQTAVPSSSCELPPLLPGRRKPKQEGKGALSQNRQSTPLKIYEKLALAP